MTDHPAPWPRQESSPTSSPVDPRLDGELVAELLGRKPQGDYEVVVRRRDGSPVVIANEPLQYSGRPMPTRYWLVDKALNKAIGTLEATGAVDQVEAELGCERLAEVHDAYAAERDARIPADHHGPVPTGGVGGTRIGVKCLHAHYAHYLAGGRDPVGVWVHHRLEATGDAFPLGPESDIQAVIIDIGDHAVDLALVQTDSGSTVSTFRFTIGARDVLTTYLHSDPPDAAELSAALSVIELYVTDMKREAPELTAALSEVPVVGRGWVETIARVERGVADPAHSLHGVTMSRSEAEELFRALATEPRADRAHNPGLEPDQVDDIVGAQCLLMEVMRQLDIEEVMIADGGAGWPNLDAPLLDAEAGGLGSTEVMEL